MEIHGNGKTKRGFGNVYHTYRLRRIITGGKDLITGNGSDDGFEPLELISHSIEISMLNISMVETWFLEGQEASKDWDILTLQNTT